MGGTHMPEEAKILIVEDDPDIVESVRLVLESAGYQVDSALTIPEAFNKVTEFKPDLVLLDIMMPDGTEGFHFVWKLRNQFPAEVANIPIVVLSAIHSTTSLRFYPDESDGTYEPGEFLPVQGFIDKPVEPHVLLERIREALAAKK
jgi:CheY-like chemotaxis protein